MAESNRDQVLEAAIECVQQRGVADTTTRDIARAAGVSLASIPYHFGSKDALMDEALMKAMRRYSTHIDEQAFEGDADPLEALARSLVVTIDSFSAVAPLLVSLMEAQVRALHSEGLRPRVAASRRAAVERIAASVRDGLELDGKLSEPQIHAVATLILAAVEGLMLAWLIEPESMPDGQALLDALSASATQLLATRAD